MMDRGEDDGWFESGFIWLMALLAFLGILGAIGWLLTAKKPIVNLDVFKDRNFAAGCILIGAMGAILYASAVIIPQFAQQTLMYTATWAGLMLSPGGVAVIILIPLVGRLMTVIQTRYVIAIGFTIMGVALLFSSTLVAGYRFPHPGDDAHGADRGPRLPVRSDQHGRLSDAAAPSEGRRGRVVLDVPQRVRLDRHFAVDRADHATLAGPSDLSVAMGQPVQPALSGPDRDLRTVPCARWGGPALRRTTSPSGASIRRSGLR